MTKQFADFYDVDPILKPMTDHRMSPLVTVQVCRHIWADFMSLDHSCQFARRLANTGNNQVSEHLILLDAGIAFCFKHLNLSGKIVGLRREEHLDIPVEALREALTNSLCHRRYDDPRVSVSLAIYDDRVEIVNPGCFTNGLTPENIKETHESFPYNHRIAQVLYLSTYLESWGTGVRRMIDLCREQGLPEPEYQSDGYTVKIVFWKKNKKDDPNVPDNVPDVPNNYGNLSMVDLTDRQRKICEMIHANSLVTTSEMSVALSVAQKTIKRDLTDWLCCSI